MTSPRNLLVRLAGALNVTGMPWMITGSTASAFYGEPRATQDIDFLVDPTPEQLQLRDAASVIAGCAGELDLGYIRREAAEAGVSHLLSRILPPAPGVGHQ